MALTALPLDARADVSPGERADQSCADAAEPAPGVAGERWFLLRNCSVSPRQMLGFYASISGVCVLIALAFAWRGAPLILGFAGLELLALGAALAVYARHARDGDVVWIDGATLHVETRRGARRVQRRLPAAHARVELERTGAGRPALWLCAGRERVAIGSQLRAHRLPAVQHQIRQALCEMQRLGP